MYFFNSVSVLLSQKIIFNAVFERAIRNLPKYFGLMTTDTATEGVSVNKAVLKHFGKFKGQNLRRRLFLTKLHASRLILRRVIFSEFCEVFRETFLHKTLPVAASGLSTLPIFLS